VNTAESRTLKVDFSLCKAQSQSYRAFRPNTRVCNAWGRGVGKSFYARLMMWLLVAEWDGKVRINETTGKEYKGIRIAFVMPTMAQFKRIGHAKDITSDLSPKGDWGFLRGDINKTEWSINFPGGSNIQVVSAENAKGYLGMRRDAVIVDEADDVDIGMFETVIGPWFTEPVSLRQILITGTPRRGRFGLLWKAFRVWPHGDATHEPMANASSTHATGYEYPALVDQGWLEDERMSVSPDRFAREYLCDFDSGEGLVYPFFVGAPTEPGGFTHVRPPPGMYVFDEFIVGYDHGFNDPAAFIVIGIAGSGKDAICHAVREHYVTHKRDTELAAIAASIELSFPGAKWYSDHHPSTIRAFKEDARVDVIPADKSGPNSVENGVAFVADALFMREDKDGKQWAQFYVDPSCTNLIQEFGLYRRKRDPSDHERVLDTIDSTRNDHALDAVRYALWTHFGGIDRRLVVG
jgi:hypothetical protein